MKHVTVAIILFVVGAGGAMVYVKANRTCATNVHADHLDPAALLCGGDADPSKFPQCPKHQIPEAICAFCHPEFAEKFGFCQGHKVPEAFCTRCSPILIAAFKAEGDWCEAHELPESQCRRCSAKAES